MKLMILLLLLVTIHSCGPTTNSPSTVVKETAPAVQPSLETIPISNDRRRWQKPELVISKLGNLRNKTIADLGAGIGFFSFQLLPKSDKVIAIDIDAESVQILEGQKRDLKDDLAAKFDVRLATSSDPNLEEEEVDIIFIVNTMTYISDRKSYLKNLRKYIKDTGKIFIVDFKTKRLPSFTEAPDINNRIYMHTLEEDLEAAGFVDIYTDDTSLDYQYIMTAYK